jgi:hypothetical protein
MFRGNLWLAAAVVKVLLTLDLHRPIVLKSRPKREMFLRFMRKVAATIGFALVLLLGLAHPSVAHEHDVVPAEAALAAPCSIKPVVAMPAPHVEDHERAHAHDHEEAEHNPGDHSHPLGSDLFHVAAFHGGVDGADRSEFKFPARTGQGYSPAFERAETGTGIAVLPPVPPPLA